MHVHINDVYLELAFLGHIQELQTLVRSTDKKALDLQHVTQTGHNAITQCVTGADHSTEESLQSFLDCIHFLSEQGVDVDAQDIDGRTALHWAVALGLDAVVTQLIKEKSHCHKEDNLGFTPVHLAIQLNAMQCLNALLRGIKSLKVGFFHVKINQVCNCQVKFTRKPYFNNFCQIVAVSELFFLQGTGSLKIVSKLV